jgi:hypothetical protein
MELPHCDTLFAKYLEPWYSAGDHRRKKFEATRPDILTAECYAGRPLSEMSVIGEEGEREAKARVETMLEACRGDWPRYLKVLGEIDERWIAAFDEYHDRKRVADIIKRSDPKDFSNDYLILVCEFGAALGYVLRSKEPHLDWVFDWPYWESSLVDRRSGSIIPPFHWAVKKFSEYGLEDRFTEKVDMCVHVLKERAG